MDAPTESIKDRIHVIRNRIKAAAERSGRSASDVQLVAVSKTFPASLMIQAVDAGVQVLGENKIQEAALKWDEFKEQRSQAAVAFHLLGSLQTNKARKAVELFDLIQSVDRPKLAQFLDRIAGEEHKVQRCFVEVKISPEESKSGIPIDEADGFIQGFSQYKNLKLEGLMTIPPFDIPENETREYFKKFKVFFDQQKNFLGEKPVLSMGMTDDYEIAIEEGSTMVRIGRAIFGQRPLNIE